MKVTCVCVWSGILCIGQFQSNDGHIVHNNNKFLSLSYMNVHFAFIRVHEEQQRAADAFVLRGAYMPPLVLVTTYRREMHSAAGK